MDEIKPVLYIVATPIGNLEDITLRALRVLKEVDLIASEDTRETKKLLEHYGIKKALVSYYKWNERERSGELLELLQSGKNVALVCDRGTPGISDPAWLLAGKARVAGIQVVPVPGPSSLTAALSVAGRPFDKFVFYGFPPRKKSGEKRFFETAGGRDEDIVFFESVHRIAKTLDVLCGIFPERKLTICRELTKKFEEIFSGTVREICENFRARTWKGEFVLILEGGKTNPLLEEKNHVS